MKPSRHSVLVSGELRPLIPRFLANRALDLEHLVDAHARGDLEQVRKIGHSLRGAGGGYGFDEITRLGAAIESAAKAGGDGLDPLLRELADFLDGVEVTFGAER